jgi:acetoin utilization deacetylase AcuC-like enzyme
MQKQDKQVSYFYDDESGNYMYNVAHPWRPHRTKLVHSLVEGYGLEKEMMVRRPRARTRDELTQFHADGGPSSCHGPWRAPHSLPAPSRCRHLTLQTTSTSSRP